MLCMTWLAATACLGLPGAVSRELASVRHILNLCSRRFPDNAGTLSIYPQGLNHVQVSGPKATTPKPQQP